MFRTFYVVLSFLLVFGLSSCSSKKPVRKTTKSDPVTSEIPVEPTPSVIEPIVTPAVPPPIFDPSPIPSPTSVVSQNIENDLMRSGSGSAQVGGSQIRGMLSVHLNNQKVNGQNVSGVLFVR